MEIRKVSENVWIVEKEGGMKVPVKIFASEKLLEKMKQDKTIIQGKNVTYLPGIYKYSIILPDGHEGYGFPIGGVAAFDYEQGCISPGGIGYDINCGVRILRTNLKVEEIKPKIKEIVDKIAKNVPSGVGSKGKIKLSGEEELDDVLKLGAKWAVEKGFGYEKDLEFIESKGSLEFANPKKVSSEAKKRGIPQLGSLGSGNHFLEIQKVDKIYDPEVAKAFGIFEENQVMIMIHTGSRGLGHQVCSDYVRIFMKSFPEIKEKLPDHELIYAPAGSTQAEDYLGAMSAAANFAWCNRQMIMHWVKESFYEILKEKVEIDLIYDVAHNICKVEEHEINGKTRKVYVHRKGGTRAFPPGHPEIPSEHRRVGQCVILPGSMGTASYILVGLESGKESFYSTAHGAGRELSRHEALRRYTGKQVQETLMKKGIYIHGESLAGIAEEVPEAYKDIDEIARVSEAVGIAKRVARLVPLGVTKG
ncbi:MAG: RtcB family protein [archaeon]